MDTSIIILIIALIFVFVWLIPGYCKILGRCFGQGCIDFFTQSIDQQFDIFYEQQNKPKKEEKENG